MYELELTGAEIQTLSWLTLRGYFPESVWKAMELKEGQPENVGPRETQIWEIPEHIAWELLTEQDQEGFLSCCGDPLASKIYKLIGEIV